MRASRFDAFISYSHGDGARVAAALQSALHRFAKPWYRLRALRVFRDQTNLSVNPGLWSSIVESLHASRYLILLCSPDAAKSKWVQREIEEWLDVRSHETLMLVVTGGVLTWDDTRDRFDPQASDVLPPALENVFREEPLWIDMAWASASPTLSIRETRFRDAVRRVAASLHGTEPDAIDGEDVRQSRRTWRLVALAAFLLIVLTGLSVVQSVRERRAANEARHNLAAVVAERARPELSEGNTLRAATYLDEALRTAPDQPWVRFMAAQAATMLEGHTVLARQAARVSDGGLDPSSGRAWMLGDDTLRLWDTSTGEPICDLPEAFPEKPVAALIDGGNVLGVVSDGRISFWDADDCRSLGVDDVGLEPPVELHTDQAGQRLLVIDGSQRAWQWQVGEWEHMRMLDRNAFTGDVSPSGDGFAVATSRGSIQLWEFDTGRLLAQMPTPETADTAIVWSTVKYSPSGRYALCGGESGLTLILDLESGSISELEGHRSSLSDVAFSEDERRVVTTDWAGWTHVWSVAEGRSELSVRTHQGLSGCIARFHPTGRWFMTLGAAEKELRVWHVPTGRRVLTLDGPRGWTLDAVFDEGSDSITALHNDGTIRRWRLEASEAATRLIPEGAALRAVGFDRSGNTVAAATAEGTVFIYDGGSEPSFTETFALVQDVAVDPQGTRVAVSRTGGAPLLIDLEGVPTHRELAWHGKLGSNTATFASEGDRLAVAGLRGAVRIYDHGELLDELDGEGLSWVAFSSDGGRLAVARRKRPMVHDLSDAGKTVLLEPVTFDLYSVAFNTTGDVVVAGGQRGQLAVWDALSGRLATIVEQHASVIRSMSFFDGDEKLASASVDDTVRIWDTRTWRVLAVLRGSGGGLIALHLDEGETTLSAASLDGHLREWAIGAPGVDVEALRRTVNEGSPWRLDQGRLVSRR